MFQIVAPDAEDRKYAAARDAGATCRPLRPSGAGKNEVAQAGQLGRRQARQVFGMSSKLGKATGVAPRSKQKSGPKTEEKQAVTPTNDRKSEELYTALVVTVIAITAGILLMSGMLWLVDSLGPQTGDIIAFPAMRIPSVSTASFTASRAIAPDGMSCILDVQTIQKFGGSLVVESRQFEPSRIYQVHWAGTRTSGGRDDCGSSADLLLNSNQISVLIFAAGGTGVKAQN